MIDTERNARSKEIQEARVKTRGKLAMAVSNRVRRSQPDTVMAKVVELHQQDTMDTPLTAVDLHSHISDALLVHLKPSVDSLSALQAKARIRQPGKYFAPPRSAETVIIGFVSVAVNDSMSAALTIPSQPAESALKIATDPLTMEAVTTHGLSKSGAFDHVETLGDYPAGHEGDVRLRYDPMADAMKTSSSPVPGRGCPLARYSGQHIQDFFGLVSEVTLRMVESPDGERLYPDS